MNKLHRSPTAQLSLKAFCCRKRATLAPLRLFPLKSCDFWGPLGVRRRVSPCIARAKFIRLASFFPIPQKKVRKKRRPQKDKIFLIRIKKMRVFVAPWCNISNLSKTNILSAKHISSLPQTNISNSAKPNILCIFFPYPQGKSAIIKKKNCNPAILL